MQKQLYHIVIVDEKGTVTLKTVEATGLGQAEQIASQSLYPTVIIAAFGEHSLDNAAEVAHHAQTAINAYKHLQELDWKLDDKT